MVEGRSEYLSRHPTFPFCSEMIAVDREISSARIVTKSAIEINSFSSFFFGILTVEDYFNTSNSWYKLSSVIVNILLWYFELLYSNNWKWCYTLRSTINRSTLKVTIYDESINIWYTNNQKRGSTQRLASNFYLVRITRIEEGGRIDWSIHRWWMNEISGLYSGTTFAIS